MKRNQHKSGQTLIEYAIIVAFISVVAISVLIALGGSVKNAQVNDHHWVVTYGTTTWVTNDLPGKDLNGDLLVKPVGQSSVIVHGDNYAVQEVGGK